MIAGSAAGQPGRIRIWLLAARVSTLSAAVVPVLVGSAAVHQYFEPVRFVVALLASLLIQLGTNLANDYFDFRSGADAEGRLGPPRTVQSGLLSPSAVALAAAVSFGLAALLGLYLVAVGGWPILAIGLASIAAAVLYTGGPWPLGYHGLGDLCTFLFFGVFAVLGMEYVYTHEFTTTGLVVSIPVAALVTAILVVNNLRDIDSDRKVGKYTLAAIIGRRATRAEYVLLLAAAYTTPLALRLAGHMSNWFWLPWLSLPLAVPLTRLMLLGEGRALNPALKGTSRLHLVFGILFAVALLT
jgi:1,4-dihydroxy-2-naphthoate octaprenyltransferase